jgi:hypothetical protein
MDKVINGIHYHTVKSPIANSCSGCSFDGDEEGCTSADNECLREDRTIWKQTHVVAPKEVAEKIDASLGIDRTKGIGDVTSDAKGSGARYNAGKADYSLIPMHLLEDTAKVLMFGEKKYARNNWMKGMKWTVPFACLMRHMFAWFRGEEVDSDSGLPHLAHAMCNLLMLTHYSKFYPEGDDRPKEFFCIR